MRLLLLPALSLLLLPAALLLPASAAPPPDPTPQQLEEELRLCSEDALPDASLAWTERGTAETLGFVTPWNGKGYEVAEKYAGKFTYISPVWLQIRHDDEARQMRLSGSHDHDQQWIQRVRAAAKNSAAEGSCAADADADDAGESSGNANSGVKIVPRVLWEMDTMMDNTMRTRAATLISQAVKRAGYDGVLLEIPIDPPEAEILGTCISSLRSLLAEGAVIIVAIPAFQSPMRGGPPELQVTPATLVALEEEGVDRFLVMCYDAVTQSGRTNSPLGFVKATVDALVGGESQLRAKMLVSLPWYGYDMNQAVLGHDVTRRLLQGGGEEDKVAPGSVELEWDPATQEQVFGYVGAKDGQPHVGTYPSPEFFRRRLQLVKDEGLAGVAIWELGQGLACFPRML